jgi:hypothetical protein
LAHPRLEALTHDAIVQAAKNLAPGSIRKWSVIVEVKRTDVSRTICDGQLGTSESVEPKARASGA